MKNKIMTRNNEKVIRSDELHKCLQVASRHNDWIRRLSQRYSLELEMEQENVLKNSGAIMKNIHFIPIGVASEVIKRTRGVLDNQEALDLLSYINELLNGNPVIIQSKRPEIDFGDMLDRITGVKWRRQVKVLDYRLDFVLADWLIVEYDEEHHLYQKEKDIEREKAIRDYLIYNVEDGARVPIIRVAKGKEYEGMQKILDRMIEVEDWQYRFDPELGAEIEENWQF